MKYLVTGGAGFIGSYLVGDGYTIRNGKVTELSEVNYPDPEGSELVIPNFVSGLTDSWRFTPTDTEFEDKSNGRQ